MNPQTEPTEVERRAKRLDALMEGVRKEAEANKNASQQKILWGVLAGLEIAASVLRESEPADHTETANAIAGPETGDIAGTDAANAETGANAQPAVNPKSKIKNQKSPAPPSPAEQDLARFRASRYAYLLEKERGPFRRRDPNLHVARVVKHKGGKSK